MRRLVAAEFAKLGTTRLWLWLLAGSVALTALYVGLTIAFSESPDTEALPLSTAAGQRMVFSLAASGPSPLVAALAAIGMTGEYRHRTATATFLATPLRGRVVAAKLIAYGAAGVGYAAVCIAVTAVIALPWLAAEGIDVPPAGNGIPATLAGVIAAVASTLCSASGSGPCCATRSPPWPGCWCTCSSPNPSSPASPPSTPGRSTCPAPPKMRSPSRRCAVTNSSLPGKAASCSPPTQPRSPPPVRC